MPDLDWPPDEVSEGAVTHMNFHRVSDVGE